MTNIFRVEKALFNLPNPLSPDTVYFVRTGQGFDLYCSDVTGNIAHSLNSNTTSTDFIMDGGLYDSENDYMLTVDLGFIVNDLGGV